MSGPTHDPALRERKFLAKWMRAEAKKWREVGAADFASILRSMAAEIERGEHIADLTP